MFAGDIGRLFPPEVAFVEATEEMYEVPVAPGEAGTIAQAVERRRRNFRAGRACARTALASIGVADAVIPVGEGRRPAWPPGTVGSITHCRGYCAAAAAHTEGVGAIGLDAAQRRSVNEELARRICTPTELRRLAAFGDVAEWATVSFSAKEAGYKALNPLTNVWIDFSDAEVDVDRERGDLTIRLVDGCLTGLELRARYALQPDVIITAVSLMPDEAAAVAGLVDAQGSAPARTVAQRRA